MSKFNPTHKTPDGTLLHSEGGKYYTQHAYENFGAAYTGPAEELDAERFVYSLRADVDLATDKAAKITALNQAMSQGQIYIPPGIRKATVSGGNLANVKPCPPATHATMKPTRDGVKHYVTLPTSKAMIGLTWVNGNWKINSCYPMRPRVVTDVVDNVPNSMTDLHAAIKHCFISQPSDICEMANLLVDEERQHRAGLAARQHASTTGTAPTATPTITLVQKLQVSALVDHAFGVAAFSTKTQISGHHTYVIIGETSTLDAALCLHANTYAKQKYPSWKVDFVAEGCPVQSAVIDYYVVNPTSFQPGRGPYWDVDEQCVIKRVP